MHRPFGLQPGTAGPWPWRRFLGILIGLELALAAPTSALTITEIMYHPTGDGVNLEYVEVHNEDVSPLLLTGYYFSDGIEYHFPDGLWITAGAYVVVAKSPSTIRGLYGITNVYGPFENNSRLDNTGERVAISNPAGAVVVEVDYRDRGKWPAAADGTGHSLSLIDPYTDPDEPESWAPSRLAGGTPGTENGLDEDGGIGLREETWIADGEDWRYQKGNVTPPSIWRSVGFDDGSWSEGPTSIGYEDDDDRTILTDMQGNYTTVYCRKWFQAPDPSAVRSLTLEVYYDDAFVAYVNSEEVARSDNAPGVPGQDIPRTATANGDHEAGPAGFETFDVSAHIGDLLAGENVLAVQVLNATIGSTDLSFSARLIAGVETAGGAPVPVVLNEALLNPAPERFIELYNPSRSSVTIGGMYLTDDRDTLKKYRIPSGLVLPAGGRRVFTEADLGFTLESDVEGGGIFMILTDQTGSVVVDAVHFDVLTDGIATIRFPDGEAQWYVTETSTPGDPNFVRLETDVVINEIMYHPHSENRDDEYIEIYNRGNRTIDLTGWHFTKAVRFTFPAGARILPGEYLVVARNPQRIADRYGIPGATYGPWERILSNRGEAIRLKDLMGNTVDEVRFHDSGEWPIWADGYGSSLELIDPRQDNSLGAAWAPSDEASKSEWTFYQYQGRAVVEGSDSEFQMFLNHRGECFIDDVSMIRGTTQHIPGGGFENAGDFIYNLNGQSSNTRWNIGGTHIHSHHSTEDSHGGNGSLRIVASGRGDTGPNRIERQTSPTLASGQTYTISFWARWIKGNNVLITRTWKHGAARAHSLVLPELQGTPGARNSVALANQGPVIGRVSQDPVLPGSGQPVTVVATIRDADGVFRATLRWRRDGGGAFATVTLHDDGNHGDGRAGDGVYGGVIPGNSTGLIEFYIEAQDVIGDAGTWPVSEDGRTALYYVGSLPQTPLRPYRLLMTSSDLGELQSRPRMDNNYLPAGFVWRDRQIYYYCEARRRGSPWIRPTGWRIRFGSSSPLFGRRRQVNLDAQGDGTHLHERYAHYLISQLATVPMDENTPLASAPYSHHDYVLLIVNGSQSGLHEDVEQVDARYLEKWWPGDDDGTLFKVDDWFEYRNDDETRGGGDRWWTTAFFDYTGTDKENYRWTFKIRSNEKIDNYTPLIETIRVMDRDTTSDVAFDVGARGVLNVDEWLQLLAVRILIGDWDTVGGRRGKNAFVYQPPIDRRFWLIPWDSDLTFGDNLPLIPTFFPSINRMLSRPQFQHRYYGYLLWLIDNPFSTAESREYLDRIYNDLLRYAGTQSPGGMESWITNRGNSVRGQISSPTFAVTDPMPIRTDQDIVTIRGRAPVTAFTFVVDGRVMNEPVWTSSTQWSLQILVPPGNSNLLFQVFDFKGRQVGSATVSIQSTVPPIPEVTMVLPNEGVRLGGEVVHVRGRRFQPGAKVWFGTMLAPETTYVNPMQLEVVTPPHSMGPVDVTTENPGGQQGSLPIGFTFVEPRPVLTHVLPDTGPEAGGTRTRIYGRYFLDDEPELVVTFGGRPALSARRLSSTEIEAETPPGAGPSDVAVTNSEFKLTGILPGGFTYTGVPFLRGDANGDGIVDIIDVITILRGIFAGGSLLCRDAADVDDSGALKMEDALRLANFVFGRADPPPAPYPDLGLDTTYDTLGCIYGPR